MGGDEAPGRGPVDDAGIPIGICGQAPSNYPEFAEFLVDKHIDSISLNPDSFLKTVEHIAEAEARQSNIHEMEPVATEPADQRAAAVVSTGERP